MYRDIVSNPFLAHYNWQCATWCFGKNSLQKPIIISSKMEKSHKRKYYLLNGLIRTLVRLSTMHWQWATWCEGRSSRRTPWRWRRCHGPGTGPTASACACSCCTIRTVEYYGFSRTNCQKKQCSNALKLFRPRLLHAMNTSLCSMQFFYASPCGQTYYCTLKTQLLFSYCTKIYQYEPLSLSKDV